MIKSELRNYVRAGRDILIPQGPPLIAGYNGTGFIACDPLTGAGAYMISSQLNGSRTIAPVSRINVVASLVWYVLNDPADLSMNPELIQLYPIVLSGAAPDMCHNLSRVGYNSLMMLCTDFQTMGIAITYSRYGLFYFGGHTSGGNTDELWFTTHRVLGGFERQRFPAAIIREMLETRLGKDGPRIVFLDACSSAGSSALSSGFWMDGEKGDGSKLIEIYIGYAGAPIMMHTQKRFDPILIQQATKPIVGTDPAKYPDIKFLVDNFATILSNVGMPSEYIDKYTAVPMQCSVYESP